MRSYLDAKAMAKALREALAPRNIDITHSEALEIVARQFGLETWNVLSARIEKASGEPGSGRISFEPAVPIVRIFDVAKAHEFYCGFLGFAIDWEHRFGDDFPLRSRAAVSSCTCPNIPAMPAPAPTWWST